MAHRDSPNFDNDMKLGKIGESDLRPRIEISPKTIEYIDVSDDPFFGLLDIDCLQITKEKENGEKYTVEDVKRSFLERTDKSFFTSYEVKTDTVSLTSRNIVFEIISHDGPGCAAISRANYFYYVFVDRNDVIQERWLIDMKKWREYIRENDKNLKPLLKGSLEEGGIALNNFNKFGDKVLNILTNIDVLEKEGIATKIY